LTTFSKLISNFELLFIVEKNSFSKTKNISLLPITGHLYEHNEHFSGPGRAIGPVCVCVRTTTFELNKLTSYLACSSSCH